MVFSLVVSVNRRERSWLVCSRRVLLTHWEENSAHYKNEQKKEFCLKEMSCYVFWLAMNSLSSCLSSPSAGVTRVLGLQSVLRDLSRSL